jgi:hypothetical protein
MMLQTYPPNDRHRMLLSANTRFNNTSPFAESSINIANTTIVLNQPCTGPLSYPDVNRLSLTATIEARIARAIAVARLQVVSDLQALHKSRQHERSMEYMNKMMQVSSPPTFLPLCLTIPNGVNLIYNRNLLPNHLPSIAENIAKVPSTSGASPKIMKAFVESPATRKQRTSSGMKYIDSIGEWDVLCGRGGRSNHHTGNKRYRHVVSEAKLAYRNAEAKTTKTDMSRAIVENVCAYGGRFIKREESTGRFFVLTKAEARKKTSQALRESKELKWTV